jgi:hypothetical protein
MPAQQKKPLNFVGDNFFIFNGHSTSNVRAANTSMALLHFKLCDELQRRLGQPSLLAQHYRRGLAYEQLRLAIEAWPNRTLLYDGTCKYSSSAALEAIGLIGDHIPQLWSDSGFSEVRTPKKRVTRSATAWLTATATT